MATIPGLNLIEAARNNAVHHEFVLTYVQATRLTCEVDLEHDHRDIFLRVGQFGLDVITVPQRCGTRSFCPAGFQPGGPYRYLPNILYMVGLPGDDRVSREGTEGRNLEVRDQWRTRGRPCPI
jgi:hypothetical protein